MSVAAPVRHQSPSLVGSDLRRFLNLTWTLAVTDWKLRFYGSVLGYVWTLARPFMFFGVIYFVFTKIAHLDQQTPHYGVSILVSLILFNFFAESTQSCVTSLVVRESLLRKMRFPRLVIPLASVLTALFNLGMTLIAVLAFAIPNGVYPRVGWLEMPLLIVCMAILATGVGLLLSALYVRYRDVQPIWDVVSQALFYASPILYVAATVPENFRSAYHASPIAAILTEARHSMVDKTAPHAWQAIGGGDRLVIPIAIIVVIFVLGLWVFAREAPRVAENL